MVFKKAAGAKYIREMRLPIVFIKGGRIGHRGVRFTDFKEHLTIFKENGILKINCRFLSLLGDMLFLFEKLPYPRILIDSPAYSSPVSQLRIRITPRIFKKN